MVEDYDYDDENDDYDDSDGCNADVKMLIIKKKLRLSLYCTTILAIGWH
jgi:hypothetical protein